MNTPEQKIEVEELLERLEREAEAYLTAGPPHIHKLFVDAAETIEALSEAVDALSDVIETDRAALAKVGVVSGDDAQRLEEAMARNSGRA